jgi:hypothetical protein
MTDYLIERLRLSADRMATANCEMCHDAADALEANQAKIDRLLEIMRASRHAAHTQSRIRGEIPAAQIKILTDMEMFRVEQDLRTTAKGE